MHGLAASLLIAAALAMPAPAAAQTALETAKRSVVSVLPILPAGQTRPEEPEGSGVVARDGRYVITALHVIEGAERILVRSAEGEVMEAAVAGRDRFTDLAVLEIETALVPAVFGDDTLLGAPVCAIGNAFGLGLSIACGIVSATHQAGVGFNPVEDFVQTDAAVNPGASGGALVDEQGRVVGVLSAIFTKTADANIGVNFAVSAPLALRVLSALVETGEYQPPRTGLRLVADPPRGETGMLAARVTAVSPGTPAERAGFEEGDRILVAGGRRVDSPADLVSAVARLAAPSVLVVEIERDGAPMTLDVEIAAEMADEPAREAAE